MKKFIVIDATANPEREKCVIYSGEFDPSGESNSLSDDLLFQVEEFFEEAGIPLEPEDVEDITDDLSTKGFSSFDDYHFEVI